LYKHARQLLITGGFMEEGLNWNNDIESKNNKSLSLSLFSRGNLANNSEPSSQNLICNPDDQEA